MSMPQASVIAKAGPADQGSESLLFDRGPAGHLLSERTATGAEAWRQFPRALYRPVHEQPFIVPVAEPFLKALQLGSFSGQRWGQVFVKGLHDVAKAFQRDPHAVQRSWIRRVDLGDPASQAVNAAVDQGTQGLLGSLGLEGRERTKVRTHRCLQGGAICSLPHRAAFLAFLERGHFQKGLAQGLPPGHVGKAHRLELQIAQVAGRMKDPAHGFSGPSLFLVSGDQPAEHVQDRFQVSRGEPQFMHGRFAQVMCAPLQGLLEVERPMPVQMDDRFSERPRLPCHAEI